MARFDVYNLKSGSVAFVVDVQANMLESLSSRVVIPLVRRRAAPLEAAPRLKPVITFQDEEYILMTTDIAAIPNSRLGERIINLETDYRDDITGALDFLFQGF